MAVRLLATIEHILGADFASMNDNEKFVLTGAQLNIIRSEILNAAGDTTRSLSSTPGTSEPGKISFSRDAIQALNKAVVDILQEDQENGDVPVFVICGDFNLLNKIRNEVGTGLVYNKTYTCVGMDNVVDSLMPFLDAAQIAGIKIANGDYKDWRDAVCELYLEGLGDE